MGPGYAAPSSARFAAPPGAIQDVVAFPVDRGIEEPFRPFPPTGAAGCLPSRQFARRQAARQGRQLGRAGCRAADVEHPGLVVPILPGHQTVPVPRAEEGPDGDRADIDATLLEPVGFLPDLGEPPHLLVRRRSQMGLGDGHRPAIPLPDLFQQTGRTRRPIREHAHGLDVSVGVAPIAAVRLSRIATPSMVKKPLAGHVVIAADDVGGTRLLEQWVELFPSQPQPPQMLPERMLLAHAPTQEIE